MGHLIHFANNIVSLFLAPGMMLALGIAVWGVAYTRSESLACYARARRIVGATFVIYGLTLFSWPSTLSSPTSWPTSLHGW